MKIKRFMTKFRKSFRKGEKGFTLIELLIVVVILGVLAAVIVPNLAGFLSTGQQAAANTEVANVETAALAYYADNSGWPTDCKTTANASLMDPPGTAAAYLSAGPVAEYSFDDFGKVEPTGTAPILWPNDPNITWNATDHEWQK